MDNFITIGEIIKHYRKEAKLSQEQLAKDICDRKYISQIEHNKCIPTLYIINQLSEKLKINLYETYALMLRHHDIETHKKIELLNQHFNIKKCEKLLQLVENYRTLPEFQSGEPRQTLLYAEALYFSNCLHREEEAIMIAMHALSEQSNFSLNNLTQNNSYSNVELTLLSFIAVNYCRIKKFEEAEYYFCFLQKYLIRLFKKDHYATNRNNQFELKFLANITYNYFVFFRKNINSDILNIDYVLDLLKSLKSTFLLPELLLCKTYIQMNQKNISEAQQLYQTAHHLGLYLYPEDFQLHIEKSILKEHFNTLCQT